MRVPHTEEDMCGDLCDFLTDVCLGVDVAHMQSGVRFISFHLLLTLSLSLSLILLTHTLTHTHSPMLLIDEIYFSLEIWSLCVRVYVRS